MISTLLKRWSSSYEGRGVWASGSFANPNYRVYLVDRSGYIAAPPRVLSCVDDEDARTQARNMIDAASDVELWQGSRLVELFAHK